MVTSLRSFLQQSKQLVEKRLPEHIQSLQAPEQLKKAMLYSLNAGGKRVRPAIVFATLQSFGAPLERGVDVACALEMIHTYSLVHDDLPAMDDDDLRRGKPTNHKVFGEALAILAGDALLTYSFQLITSLEKDSVSDKQKVELIHEISRAAGPAGMVGGQVADMAGEDQSLTLDELLYIHHHKTGDLLTASVMAGAILAEASEADCKLLRQFSKELGLIFQIKDDILDVEGDSSVIGKPVGSDVDNKKSTYPNLLGLDGAKEKLSEHMSLAKEYIYGININHSMLIGLTEYIANRDH
ncbi:polyprenyl synthetase family protein [Alkalihalobacillus hemicellulosilyticus]|uniref:polyprenyl synthetase family protein n=1 Tax=Halalkalibacter hemicellulosilyticus TaxID=127886 RepID=UPI0011DCAA18|nr:farnesyl diphosphate synthase [Halalkalibacter hemicellulosilyticus]